MLHQQSLNYLSWLSICQGLVAIAAAENQFVVL